MNLRMCLANVGLVGTCIVIGMFGKVQANPITLPAVAAQNYDVATPSVTTDDLIIASGGGFFNTSFVTFDLSTLPVGADLGSVVLELDFLELSIGDSDFGIIVGAGNDDGFLSAADFLVTFPMSVRLPGIGSAVDLSTPLSDPVSDTVLSFDLSGQADAFESAAGGSITLAFLDPDETDPAAIHQFGGLAAAAPPQLVVVTAVPEPSMVSIAFALSILAVKRRRRLGCIA